MASFIKTKKKRFIPTNYSTKLLNSVEIPLVENVFWKYYFEEFVLSSWRVSPLTKPFLDPYYMGGKMRSVYTEMF